MKTEMMVAALYPKKPQHPKQLNPRLQQLIDRKTYSSTLVKLEKRLKQVQDKANGYPQKTQFDRRAQRIRVGADQN